MFDYLPRGPRVEAKTRTTTQQHTMQLRASKHYVNRITDALLGVCLPHQGLFTIIFVLCGLLFTPGQSSMEFSDRLIGATAKVTEVSTGLQFRSRVDTGATTSSIHTVAMEIEDIRPIPSDNIGSTIRFQITNSEGESHWIQSQIADYVTVQTSEEKGYRYKVPIKLRWKDVEKEVLVTLNDRSKMKYPLLLGRNFLRDDFIVQVALDANE